MRYTIEFIPEVTWEPDTDKWRIFPESKLNKEYYKKFVDRQPLNEVHKYEDDSYGVTYYIVEIEANHVKEAFDRGYDLITEYMVKHEI